MPSARRSDRQTKSRREPTSPAKPKQAGRAPAPSVPGETLVKPTDSTLPVGPRKRSRPASKGDMPDTLDARKQFRGTDEHAAAPSRARRTSARLPR